jgi:hypothetical protein
MMKPAKNWYCCDMADLLRAPKIRRILVDSLENLHEEVCTGKMPLADAQKCIASNWVECWKEDLVPRYGPGWAAANRHLEMLGIYE